MSNWYLTTWAGALVALFLSSAVGAAELYHNLTGYTFQGEAGEKASLGTFTVLVVEDGRVIAKGGESLLDEYEDAERINLFGRTVLPGLIDSHGHVQGLGENLLQVDLRGVNNRTATVAKVANYADRNLHLEWIIGRGWNQELWPVRDYPDRHDLDNVIMDRPVWLTRVDAHAGWANSQALELAGITAETEDPPGGQIIRDAEGEPTGILIDTAMDLVRDVMPEVSRSQQQEAVVLAQQHLTEMGLTQVVDAGVTEEGLNIYRHLHDENELLVRVNAMVSGAEENLDQLLSEGIYRSENDRLRIGNVKIYGDGALGSRGARMIEPYSDDEDSYGLLVTPEERVSALFDKVHQAGFQISYHAIGDYPNRLALDEFARILEETNNESLQTHRHRIEHAQIVQVKDIPRFKELGIIPSMQPTHATSDMNMAENRVGEERIAGAYAWRSFLEQGSIIAAGSDFPVELANPFFGLHAAVTRQDRENNPVEGWYPEQAMTFAEALRSFTIDAAYAGFMDDTTGTLEEGKWADFIVVDKDPFRIKSKKLWRVQVMSTYVAGEQVFHRAQ